nr:NAD-dependent glycerol-3-phosphate dehydrogenase C-terminus [uncultured bacterium]
MRPKKTLIIGGGRLGHAIRHALLQAHQSVEAWDIKAERRSSPLPFETLAHEAHIFFIAAPTKANRSIAQKLLPSLNSSDVVISFAKGLEAPSASRVDTILREEIGKRAVYGFLTGPMLAAEIESGQPTFAELALSQKSAFGGVERLLEKTSISLTYNSDLPGLVLASVFKNCYAVGLGMFDALGYGTNFKSALTVYILGEMENLLSKLGGKKETVWGRAGLGDMLTTGWGNLSYNYHTGKRIVNEHDTTFKSEGCEALRQMKKFLGKKAKLTDFPVLAAIHSIVNDDHEPRKTFEKLLHHTLTR